MAVSLRISPELLSKVDREAAQSQLSRSELVRVALESFLAEKRRQRIRGEYIKQAQTLANDDTWKTLQDEFARSDSEALEVAEPNADYRVK